jgi:pimeloyl-ACP methyl ester carboxylesterase
LYFHGQSIWGYNENTLEKNYWKRTLSHFFEQHQIKRFSIVGYSLGGKFVLATLEAFPEKTAAILLLAPDGIKNNFWYQLATYPLLSRKLFKSMIDHPKRFQSIARTLHKWGMVSNGVLKFSEFQMNTREKRARVYYSWVVFRHLTFNLNHIAHLINQHNIVTTIIVGQYDQVIKPGSMLRLLKKVNKYNFETPEVGHTGLISASGEYFNNSKFLAG